MYFKEVRVSSAILGRKLVVLTFSIIANNISRKKHIVTKLKLNNHIVILLLMAYLFFMHSQRVKSFLTF